MKKIVKESINEKFKEDSDPIDDLKIGIKHRIKFIDGLSKVEYKASKETKKLKSEIEAFLIKELKDKYGIKISSVDLIKENNKYGFAFAFSKFDPNFTAEVSIKSSFRQYRYKTKEVERVIRKMILKFGLNPEVKYGRGFGVFVYNIFMI